MIDYHKKFTTNSSSAFAGQMFGALKQRSMRKLSKLIQRGGFNYFSQVLGGNCLCRDRILTKGTVSLRVAF